MTSRRRTEECFKVIVLGVCRWANLRKCTSFANSDVSYLWAYQNIYHALSLLGARQLVTNSTMWQFEIRPDLLQPRHSMEKHLRRMKSFGCVVSSLTFQTLQPFKTLQNPTCEGLVTVMHSRVLFRHSLVGSMWHGQVASTILSNKSHIVKFSLRKSELIKSDQYLLLVMPRTPYVPPWVLLFYGAAVRLAVLCGSKVWSKREVETEFANAWVNEPRAEHFRSLGVWHKTLAQNINSTFRFRGGDEHIRFAKCLDDSWSGQKACAQRRFTEGDHCALRQMLRTPGHRVANATPTDTWSVWDTRCRSWKSFAWL